MRRAARTDGNHRELLDLARTLGGFVIDCSALGQGKPDAFVFVKTHWRAIEIKDGSKSPSKQALTVQQKTLHAMAPITLWRSREDVLATFGVTE